MHVVPSEPPRDADQLRAEVARLREELDRARAERVDPAELASLLSVVQAAAKGDLTAAVPKTEGPTADLNKAVGRLLARFRSTAKALQGHQQAMSRAAENLKDVAKSVNDAALSTLDEAQEIATSSREVDGQVQMAADNVGELSRSIADIARSTSEAASFASEGVQVAEQTTEAVSKLGESSAAIDRVVKVISGIAQQTNLLALNATIEAARAGSAGKGFAVVATEVKELARETANATTHIGAQIEAIQSDSRSAGDAIGRIAERITRVATLQQEIATTVDAQQSTVGDIVVNVRTAAEGMGTIASGVERVAERARKTEQSTMDARVGVGEMQQTTVELGEVLGRFRA